MKSIIQAAFLVLTGAVIGFLIGKGYYSRSDERALFVQQQASIEAETAKSDAFYREVKERMERTSQFLDAVCRQSNMKGKPGCVIQTGK